MNIDIVKRYIAMPMAIKVFKQDKERFNEFKLGNLYEDMLDSIIERMQQDFFNLKDEMNSKHINLRKIDSLKYRVNGEVMEFSSEELKEMTGELMSEYLHGDKAGKFELKDRIQKEGR